jgi:uncharacterized membrane protein YhaH (DUF805 family)
MKDDFSDLPWANEKSILTRIAHFIFIPLSFRGRINRSQFFKYNILMLTPYLSFWLTPENISNDYLLLTFNIIFYLSAFYCAVGMIALCVRRIHDLGHGGLWVLSVLIINPLWLVLLIWPGQLTSNQYGRKP